MLSVNKIELHFGGETLFQDISFLVNPGDRIGLIGRNGAGKSTLLKIIANKITPDGGEVAKPNDYKIGFLTQDIQHKKGISIWEETATSFEEIKALEKKLEELNTALAERDDYESQSYMDLVHDLTEFQERYQLLGGYTYQAEMERVLLGLGFTQEEFERNIETFSGGWQMRVELAKILLQNNDLLLLDEPTNHLDIESIMWLEEFLMDNQQAAIIVSHDRAFLNNSTNRTLEISLGRSYDFPVPYHKFVELRADIREKQMAAKKNQEKEIKQTQELIDRFRAKASKASFAQSLIKRLDKMDIIEVEEEDDREMHFRFPPAPHSGKVVLKGEHIHKAYGEKKVLTDIDIEIERGDKIAFVGQNGQGKTTLVKVLLEEVEHQGKVTIGHQVKVGYYAQNQADAMDGNKTVLRTIEDAADDETRKRARSILGSFMFSGEDVEKKVKVLSGGERGRLALCKMMLEPANVLVLDEPTNHLDMRAKDVLKSALAQYDGTLILVSHDRDFLSGLVNKTYEFREGKIKPYLGGIEFFLEQRKIEDMRLIEKRSEEKAKKEKKGDTRADQKAQREAEKEKKKLERELSKIESEVEQLEAQIAEWDVKLQDPAEYEKLSKEDGFFNTYEKAKSDLQAKMKSWEDVHLKLEAHS
ncbi:MAG: ABC-F family ATP-binding cassette domain-containing protein [Flavobacteriia bacterium]|nr:ABC-F family ATP-binding cassette domain-containing protein [Flavobacteriia bacterium]